ncbi:MAG: hypothetical protein CMF59_10745 [Leptospiraceae bacterium]|nr:hypothetical protein [Leptospiraceae bacterium]
MPETRSDYPPCVLPQFLFSTEGGLKSTLRSLYYESILARDYIEEVLSLRKLAIATKEKE